jgi:hypothetical protein
LKLAVVSKAAYLPLLGTCDAIALFKARSQQYPATQPWYWASDCLGRALGIALLLRNAIAQPGAAASFQARAHGSSTGRAYYSKRWGAVKKHSTQFCFAVGGSEQSGAASRRPPSANQ